MRLVVGAKADEYPGFISTDARSGRAPLDVRRRADWLRYFPPASLDVIVCEHVLEHMTIGDGLEALRNFRSFLKPGGLARIAVPDAWNPSPAYQSWCAPGSLGRLLLDDIQTGPGHVTHYNVAALCSLINEAGLTPRSLEWHDAAGRFWRAPYDLAAAPIKRRAGSEYARNFFGPVLGFENTSLIVDAVKGL